MPSAAWAALGLLLCAASLGAPAAAQRKNVLMFAVDDLRAQLHWMGDHPPGAIGPTMHTPNIDALAGGSLKLHMSQVQQAVCSPTRTSLLTGRRPDTCHIYDLWSYFRATGCGNVTTLPQFFKQQNYQSIGMGKIFHPGHASGQNGTCPLSIPCGDDQAFSWSTPYFHAPDGGYWTGTDAHKKGVRAFRPGDSWAAVPADIEAAHPLPDSQTKDNALATLKQLEAAAAAAEAAGEEAQPFFLAVGFHKPHLPFIFPERYLDLYPASEVQLPTNPKPPTAMPPVAWSRYGELLSYADQKALNASGEPGTDLPDDDVLALRRAYMAAVSFTDSNVGEVMAALNASRFAKDTIVALWGDHGWQLGEHGEWCKHTNFNLATHAPMLVKVPGATDVAPGGIDYKHPSEFVDLFPTLAEAATGFQMERCPPSGSANTPLCTEGRSLVPAFTNASHEIADAAFSQYPRGYVKPGQEAAFAAGALDEAEALGVGSSPGDLGRPTGPGQCLKGRCTMGYSMLKWLNGTHYRYTEWVDFNTVHALAPDWNRVVGVELYDHDADAAENANLAGQPQVQAVQAELHTHLLAGWRRA